MLKVMSEAHIKRLIHNVFPVRKSTLLHFIAGSNVGFESVDFLTNMSKKSQFVVPFLTDIDGMTPLDIAVNRKDHKLTNSLVRMLSKAPMDHHSRLISHLIPQLIDMGLPALEKYFDKRRYSTGVCKMLNIGRI